MQVTVRLTGMLLILLIGVVIGLQTAERGIYKVSGLPEQQTQTFYIKRMDQGQLEISLMGKQVQAANPDRMVNYVSHAGMTLGNSVRDGARWFVEWVGNFFEP